LICIKGFPLEWDWAVIETTTTDLSKIEDAQAGLRECIEATKQLAERADGLLQQHKARLEQQHAERQD
jgi:hypothetical protein